MWNEQKQAEDNLHSLSQATCYLYEWAGKKGKKGKNIPENKETIPEQPNYFEQPQPEALSPLLKRDASDRYDLKQWERKHEQLNQIDYPVMQKKRKGMRSQSTPVLPKFKPTDTRHKNKKKPPPTQLQRVIQQRMLKKKLYEEDIRSQPHREGWQQGQRRRSLPRILRGIDEPSPAGGKASEGQIDMVKKIVENYHKKHSVPQILSMLSQHSTSHYYHYP